MIQDLCFFFFLFSEKFICTDILCFGFRLFAVLPGEKSCTSQPNLVDPVTKTDVPKGNEAILLNEYFCSIAERLGFDPHDSVVYDNNEFLNCYDMIEKVFAI